MALPLGYPSPPFSVPKTNHLTNQPSRHDAQSLPFLKSIPNSKSTSILKYPTVTARYIQTRSQIFLLPNGPGPRIRQPTLTRPAASWQNSKFIKSWITLTPMTHKYLHCVSTHTLCHCLNTRTFPPFISALPSQTSSPAASKHFHYILFASIPTRTPSLHQTSCYPTF